MLHKFKLYLIALLLPHISNAQLDYSDEELKYNIEFFRNATVSLGKDTVISFEDSNGKINTKRIFLTIGTGVIFYFTYEDGIIPCVVTAKHVLKDSLKGWNPDKLNIRFGNQDSFPIDKNFGDVYNLRGFLNQPIWLGHPDSTVDLAAFLLNPDKENSRNFGRFIPYSYIVNDEEYFEGREVYVLGYPGVVGFDLLNRAVLRRGIISWVPTDIEKSGNKILIDCNIFPGNSGGPVFISSKNASTILKDTVLQKPRFLGIVSQKRISYNPIIANGKTITDPIGQPVTSMESVSIGVIVTAKKVKELLSYVQKDFLKWADWMDKKEKEKVKKK
jgi:hypothetical protein